MDEIGHMEFQRCRSYLAAALEHSGGTHTLDDVEAELRAGRLQLWTGPASAIVTEILEYPQQKHLHVFLAGGQLEEIAAMYDEIARWAKSIGCTHARCTGRPGWARTFLKDRGWTLTHHVVTGAL